MVFSECLTRRQMLPVSSFPGYTILMEARLAPIVLPARDGQLLGQDLQADSRRGARSPGNAPGYI